MLQPNNRLLLKELPQLSELFWNTEWAVLTSVTINSSKSSAAVISCIENGNRNWFRFMYRIKK